MAFRRVCGYVVSDEGGMWVTEGRGSFLGKPPEVGGMKSSFGLRWIISETTLLFFNFKALIFDNFACWPFHCSGTSRQ